MKDLKVALLVPSLDGGGAQRVMVNLSNELSKEGVKVYLITTNRGVFFNEIESGVDVVILPKTKMILNVFFLARFIGREKPNILMSTLDAANIISPFSRLISLYKTKVIVREASTLNRFNKKNINFRSWLALWKMRLSYRLADGVIANSEDTKQDLYNYRVVSRKSSISVIYNPVFSDNLITQGDDKCDHDWVTNGTRYILSVGRLNPAKDHTSLIKAVSYVVNKGHNIKLIILGEGVERSKNEKLAIELGISDRVSFPGFQENPYPFYKHASLFCLTSRWEGFGNVLIEALAFGLPVISTDCSGGPRVILDNEKYGKLVPVGDVLAITNAIDCVLSKRLSFTEMDQKKRAQDFSIEKKSQEYLNMFMNI